MNDRYGPDDRFDSRGYRRKWGQKQGPRRGIDLAAAIGSDLYVPSVVDTREIESAISNLDANDRTEREQLFEGAAERAVDTVANLACTHLSGRVTTAVEWDVSFRDQIRP